MFPTDGRGAGDGLQRPPGAHPQPLQESADERGSSLSGVRLPCPTSLHLSLRLVSCRVGVDYFTHFFVSLDKLVSRHIVLLDHCIYPSLPTPHCKLHSEAVSRLENFGGELSGMTYEIFLIVGQMKDMAEFVHES